MGMLGESQEAAKYSTILKMLAAWVFSILTLMARSSAAGPYADVLVLAGRELIFCSVAAVVWI